MRQAGCKAGEQTGFWHLLLNSIFVLHNGFLVLTLYFMLVGQKLCCKVAFDHI